VNFPWKDVLSRKRLILALFLGTLACALLAFAIAVLWPGLGLRLASIHFGVQGLVSFSRPENGVPNELKVAVALMWLLLTLLFLVNLRYGSGKWRYLTVATLAIPLWPSNDPEPFSVSGRLAVLFVFIAIPLAIILLDETSHQSFSFLENSRAKWTLTLAAVAMTVLLPERLSTYRPLLSGYDYSSFEKVVADLRPESIPMLIAHRGLDFFYSYRLRRDAFHFDPEPGWKRSDIWRVALRITPEEAAYYSPAGCRWGETARTIPGTDYLLVREDCWELMRANVSAEENPDLYVELWQDSENPSQLRPAFLRDKHRGLSEKDFPAGNGQR
jgi:hypothetical protein